MRLRSYIFWDFFKLCFSWSTVYHWLFLSWSLKGSIFERFPNVLNSFVSYIYIYLSITIGLTIVDHNWRITWAYIIIFILSIPVFLLFNFHFVDCHLFHLYKLKSFVTKFALKWSCSYKWTVAEFVMVEFTCSHVLSEKNMHCLTLFVCDSFWCFITRSLVAKLSSQ